LQPAGVSPPKKLFSRSEKAPYSIFFATEEKACIIAQGLPM
jgi:hypothetical protein